MLVAEIAIGQFGLQFRQEINTLQRKTRRDRVTLPETRRLRWIPLCIDPIFFVVRWNRVAFEKNQVAVARALAREDRSRGFEDLLCNILICEKVDNVVKEFLFTSTNVLQNHGQGFLISRGAYRLQFRYLSDEMSP